MQGGLNSLVQPEKYNRLGDEMERKVSALEQQARHA
jgi:hypothetical protein